MLLMYRDLVPGDVLISRRHTIAWMVLSMIIEGTIVTIVLLKLWDKEGVNSHTVHSFDHPEDEFVFRDGWSQVIKADGRAFKR